MKIVHGSKKHHKCDSCGKTFSVVGTLKTHNNSVHNMQDHKCDACGKSFSGAGSNNFCPKISKSILINIRLKTKLPEEK